MAERNPYPPLTLGTDTREQVARAARRLGVSEEEAIRRALAALSDHGEQPQEKPNAREWLAAYRREHPLPPPTGLLADKAFYDDLSGGL